MIKPCLDNISSHGLIIHSLEPPHQRGGGGTAGGTSPIALPSGRAVTSTSVVSVRDDSAFSAARADSPERAASPRRAASPGRAASPRRAASLERGLIRARGIATPARAHPHQRALLGEVDLVAASPSRSRARAREDSAAKTCDLDTPPRRRTVNVLRTSNAFCVGQRACI